MFGLLMNQIWTFARFEMDFWPYHFVHLAIAKWTIGRGKWTFALKLLKAFFINIEIKNIIIIYYNTHTKIVLRRQNNNQYIK